MADFEILFIPPTGTYKDLVSATTGNVRILFKGQAVLDREDFLLTFCHALLNKILEMKEGKDQIVEHWGFGGVIVLKTNDQSIKISLGTGNKESFSVSHQLDTNLPAFLNSVVQAVEEFIQYIDKNYSELAYEKKYQDVIDIKHFLIEVKEKYQLTGNN